MEKMTYVAALTFAIDTLNEQITASGCADWDEQALAVIDKLTALKTQTEKRSNSERKPSKAQLAKRSENEALADTLFTAMANWGQAVTVAEIKTLDNAFADLSSPKLTALLKMLVAERKVAKDDSGRVAKYTALA